MIENNEILKIHWKTLFFKYKTKCFTIARSLGDDYLFVKIFLNKIHKIFLNK